LYIFIFSEVTSEYSEDRLFILRSKDCGFFRLAFLFSSSNAAAFFSSSNAAAFFSSSKAAAFFFSSLDLLRAVSASFIRKLKFSLEKDDGRSLFFSAY
jgi:hypothetical protein